MFTRPSVLRAFSYLARVWVSDTPTLVRNGTSCIEAGYGQAVGK